MTKKLRLRFVIFAMVALIAMLALIILFSAQRSYRNLVDKADAQIGMIQAAYPQEANVDARYFVAIVKNGQEKKLDMTHIRTVKKDLAKIYVTMALESGEDQGFVDTFRYQIYRQPEGLRIIFLSRSHNLEALKQTANSQVIFSGVALGVMLVVLVGVSYWVSRPVKRSYEKQQQFITSASHQLGTPLTVIKASTDILQMDDPDNEWLHSIQKQVGFLTHMTQDMITLAKLEERGNKLQRIEFSLTDVAEDVAENFKSLSLRENKPLHLQIAKGLTYDGDENMIRHLLTILLDNAFKYCPAEGQVTLILETAGKGAAIAVCNTVASLDPKTLPAFFERFYRGDSEKSGFGLGLSIAQSIVKCHKGTICAQLEAEDKIGIHVMLK